MENKHDEMNNSVEETSLEKSASEENSSMKKEKMKTGDKVFIGITSAIILILATYLILFSTVFFHVSVSGRSMDNTLRDGDILIVNKLKTPERGDVIIISGMKESGEWLVKRVIGVEGDVVSIKGGVVYLNGELLEEDYAIGSTYAPDSRDENDVLRITYTVDEGEIFFLGDNREDSLDSRFYGKCKIENVEGVATENAIRIKGITTPVNKFFIKVKSFFGFKTGIIQG